MTDHAEGRVILEGARAAAEIFGRHDEHLSLVEKKLGVRVVARGEEVTIIGDSSQVARAREVFDRMQDFYRAGRNLTAHEINYIINTVQDCAKETISDLARSVIITAARGKQVRPKTIGQQKYIDVIRSHDIVFSIGPAGTGKTYLAVAMAILALRNKEVQHLVLTRPAVEAGEKLGFLPGDLQEKVDPYLRPLFDSLYDLMGFDNTQRFVERQIIEIAPLAYMRGRTLDKAMIILDEAQNTTIEQMKMFLTRLGVGSKAVITGDITQIDLPRGQVSGLIHAEKILRDIPGIMFYHLTGRDIVRHPLVQDIVRAYEEDQSCEGR